MTVQLPPAVRAYFEAANGADPDPVVACFIKDGRVHDEHQDHLGREAIGAWARHSRRKYTFHAKPFSVDADGDDTVVKAHLTGNFPGAPADLTYRFALADGKIASLSIG